MKAGNLFQKPINQLPQNVIKGSTLIKGLLSRSRSYVSANTGLHRRMNITIPGVHGSQSLAQIFYRGRKRSSNDIDGLSQVIKSIGCLNNRTLFANLSNNSKKNKLYSEQMFKDLITTERMQAGFLQIFSVFGDADFVNSLQMEGQLHILDLIGLFGIARDYKVNVDNINSGGSANNEMFISDIAKQLANGREISLTANDMISRLPHPLTFKNLDTLPDHLGGKLSINIMDPAKSDPSPLIVNRFISHTFASLSILKINDGTVNFL
ncbi:MAG: hypothetical protein KAJ19_22055, partial [Gammaproteobacteria bacterium]|nr:hypothetical protein [Gammaproteobacteria bacterium]